MDEHLWDERYRSQDQLFSGAPNGVLVAEVTGLPPGQALDVGCGEGGDALWLARNGWYVTAVDVSRVALERAASHSETSTGAVAWIRADLTAMAPPANAFDLVSAHYFPLPRRKNHGALRGLLAAVAPGGTLLVVSHDIAGLTPDSGQGFDPSRYYQPDEIVTFLDDTWTVVANETRPRITPAPPGTHHTHDTVLRARRKR
ncbi:MAG: methyltransferase domain-containing protein [Pseudonocardiaceae bacterium]|nr:methyltransferase domain-containing protein [Pseudonocardiaceae bacterium]